MTFRGAFKSALTFMTRVPVGATSSEWAAFCATPATFPLVGFVLGTVLSIPLLAAGWLPASTVAVGYLLGVYLLTGIHHLDGIADLGDAAVVHGNRERRHAVLKDTTTGVGAIAAVTLLLIGLALAALEVATLPLLVAVGIVIGAEVGGKLGMAAMACFATASHEGLGSQLTSAVGPRAFVLPAAVGAPALVVTWPHPAGGLAVFGALLGAAVPWWWARRNLGGVSGDVFGAANELGRLFGLHAGVIAWTLW